VAIVFGLFVAILVRPTDIAEQIGEIIAYTFWAWVISRLFPESIRRLKDFVSQVFLGELIFVSLVAAVMGIEFGFLWLTGG
jgi:hypothetical protein